MAKIIDKVLNVFKLDYSDEYDDDYDGYDEAEEIAARKKQEHEEEKRRKREEKERRKAADAAHSEKTDRFSRNSRSSNVVPLNGGSFEKMVANMEISMVCPRSNNDKKEIADTLLAGKSVVINMDGLDAEMAQSVLDFTSGVCYAIKGNIQNIAKYIVIAAPGPVSLKGDFDKTNKETIDLSSMNIRI